MSSKYAYQLVAEEFYLGSEDQVDLGEQIRKQLKNLTNSANLTSEADAKLNKQIDALERLTSNIYGKKYPRSYDSTATGLTAQQCNQVLSSEFLQYLNDNGNKKRRKTDS